MLVALCGLNGCDSKKPIETIFVSLKIQGLFVSDIDYKWYEAKVIEKKGNMWKISVEDATTWIDIIETNVKFTPTSKGELRVGEEEHES